MPAAVKNPLVDLADKRLRELRRELTFTRDSVNKDARTCDLSFASETPVERWFGNEVLDCTGNACDMNRLNDGAPLLRNHDPMQQIGVVEKASMGADKKARAMVRFSRSQAGEEAFQDVQDGILRKVSVGYAVKNMVLEEQNEDGPDTYRVTSWEPYEVSLVSLPADNSVGVGRSKEPTIKQSKMETETEKKTEVKTEVREVVKTVNEKDVRTAELNRIREITAVADKFKVPTEKRDQYINEGTHEQEFKNWVLREHIQAKPVETSPDIGMSRKDKKRYSLLRAFNTLANNRPLDGLEKETSDAVATRIKQNPQGFFIPHDMAMFDDEDVSASLRSMSPSMRSQMRTMTASTFGQGGATIQTDVLGGSLIEILRNRMYLTRLGVRNLSGLVGNIAIPRQSGASTGYWLAEGDSVTASNQALSQLGLVPKRLAAQTGYTKQLLAQSSIDVESFVREDQMAVLAIAKDLAGIAGIGGKQPLGILNTPNVNSLTFGAAATWNNVVTFETNIALANADVPGMNWLTAPNVRGKWKTAVKVANYPVFLCENNEANGYPLWASNQVPGGQVIFGNFSDAIYADWAGWDVVVDPYTQAASGQVIITMTILTDFGVRHPASFCVSTDSGAQ